MFIGLYSFATDKIANTKKLTNSKDPDVKALELLCYEIKIRE